MVGLVYIGVVKLFPSKKLFLKTSLKEQELIEKLEAFNNLKPYKLGDLDYRDTSKKVFLCELKGAEFKLYFMPEMRGGEYLYNPFFGGSVKKIPKKISLMAKGSYTIENSVTNITLNFYYPKNYKMFFVLVGVANLLVCLVLLLLKEYLFLKIGAMWLFFMFLIFLISIRYKTNKTIRFLIKHLKAHQ
jgi:hypothetical protein